MFTLSFSSWPFSKKRKRREKRIGAYSFFRGLPPPPSFSLQGPSFPCNSVETKKNRLNFRTKREASNCLLGRGGGGWIQWPLLPPEEKEKGATCKLHYLLLLFLSSSTSVEGTPSSPLFPFLGLRRSNLFLPSSLPLCTLAPFHWEGGRGGLDIYSMGRKKTTPNEGLGEGGGGGLASTKGGFVWGGFTAQERAQKRLFRLSSEGTFGESPLLYCKGDFGCLHARGSPFPPLAAKKGVQPTTMQLPCQPAKPPGRKKSWLLLSLFFLFRLPPAAPQKGGAKLTKKTAI